jgi:glycosyltransferase involved in cell wall biosynthesis
MPSGESAPRLWIDVTTLVGWRGNPTGIVRVASELVRHWLTDLPAARLCAFDKHGGFRAVTPDELLRPAAPRSWRPWRIPRRDLDVVQRNARVRWYWIELRKLRWHLLKVFVSLYWLTRGAALFFIRRMPRVLAWPRSAGGSPRVIKSPFAPGDVVLVACAGWEPPEAKEDLFALHGTLGLRLAHIVYDITPVRHPQWCPPGFVGAFSEWLPGALRHSALVLTISEYSRRDLTAYAEEQGIEPPPMDVIRLGDEPGTDTSEEAAPGVAEGPFALFVSGVAPHKNHQLLVHVWRRLLERHGPDRVPALVLVGAAGFRGSELLLELHADRRLRGKVIHLAKANDRQLRWLYRRCLFTLYPSHYEGWGLPVAESLVHGKPCICSNAASLPEVGGGFADYHDPLDAPGCVRLVEQALFEPGWLQARAGRIGRDYRVTTWKDCAAQVARLLAERLGVKDAPRRRDAA